MPTARPGIFWLAICVAMKESMDLRRCGSSGGVADADEFCAKDKVAYARVTAANSKILAILTEHPFRNNYLKPSKHQVLCIRYAATWRLYREISLAEHADIRKNASGSKSHGLERRDIGNKILVDTRRRRPKTNGSFVFVDDPVYVTPEAVALANA